MIARGFKSVIWVAAVGGAAIGCYMVSLQVATERAELARVESQIIAAKRDIRTLQTELGTRGRMSQLEQWNAEVLALSAPTAAQFLPDQMTLARFDRPEATLDERGAQVRMASADAMPEAPAAAAPAAPVVNAVAAPAAPQPLVRQASFTPDAPKPAAEAKPKAASAKAEAKKPEPKAETRKVKVAKVEPAKKPETAKKSETAKKPEATAAAKTAPAKTAAKAPSEKPRAAKIGSQLAADLKSPAKKAQGSGGN
jgi:hypothetical protein